MKATLNPLSKTLSSLRYVTSGQVINLYIEKGSSSPLGILIFPGVKMSTEQRPGITCSSP